MILFRYPALQLHRAPKHMPLRRLKAFAFIQIYIVVLANRLFMMWYNCHKVKIVHTTNTKLTGDLFENFFLICKVTPSMTARQADFVSDQKKCAAFF